MNHLDLLFRLSNLGCLERFQISNVLHLEVLNCGIMSRVKTVAHCGNLIV